MFKKGEKKPTLPSSQPAAVHVHKKQKKQDTHAFDQIKQQLVEAIRILRTLEDRYNNLTKKVQLTDKNMIQEHKILNKELRLVDSDLIDTKKVLNELDYKFGLVIKELNVRAKKKDVDFITKYLDLWQPMTFIRRKDADRLIDDLLKDKIKKKKKVIE